MAVEKQSLRDLIGGLGAQVPMAYENASKGKTDRIAGQKSWWNRSVEHVFDWSISGADANRELVLDLHNLERAQQLIVLDTFMRSIGAFVDTQDGSVPLRFESGRLIVNLFDIRRASNDSSEQAALSHLFEQVKKWADFLVEAAAGHSLESDHTFNFRLDFDEAITGAWSGELDRQIASHIQRGFREDDTRLESDGTSLPIAYSKALGVDLGRAVFRIYDVQGRETTGWGEAAKENVDTHISMSETRAAALHNQFIKAAVNHDKDHPTRAMQNGENALMDFSKMIHQGIFGDLMTKAWLESPVQVSATSKIYDPILEYDIRMQANGEAIVEGLFRISVGCVTVHDPNNEEPLQYYCDPHTSSEEMRASIKFTPAYLSTDGKPHFEVLSASYDRRLDPIQ